MTNEEYHAHPAIGSSDLKTILDCPARFRFRQTQDQEQTDALKFGSAFHAAVLEPDLFISDFAVYPNINRLTKAGKKEYAEFCEANADKTIIKADQHFDCTQMADKIRRAIPRAFEDAIAIEQPLFWYDDDTGVHCKCKPDLFTAGLCIDPKTTTDASPEGFSKSVVNYKYHLSAAYYLDGLKANGYDIDKFILVAIEKKEPYLFGTYILDWEFIEAGRELYKQALRIYADCEGSGEWPEYGTTTLTKPGWL